MTLSNWINEVYKFCPSLSIKALYGDKDTRTEIIQELYKYDILCTTYEMCIIHQNYLRRQEFYYIIIDEAHRIKNERSRLSIVVRNLNSLYRLLITGTPLQNNAHELWSLLNFLKPEIFKCHEQFDKLFTITNNENLDNVSKRLHRLLHPFILRRLKSEVATTLPKKIETKLYIHLTSMQRQLYKKILSNDIDAIIGNHTNRTQLLNITVQLRKVCNHPYLFPGIEPGPPYEEGQHLIDNSGKMIV